MTPVSPPLGLEPCQHALPLTMLLAGAALLLGFAATLPACSPRRLTGPVPNAPGPPEVVAVYPAPRASRVPYDVQPTVRFRAALDSTTVNARTVFLKLDTRRIPASITLTDSARVILIRPLRELDLRETYTVRLSTELRTTEGGHLAAPFSWQFTTVSVRLISAPQPANGASYESPVATLFWRPTDSNAGPVEYDGFRGFDSTMVARADRSDFTVPNAHYIPAERWPMGAHVYWRIRVRNLETGESSDGPVWSFTVAPATAIVDSLFVAPVAYGYWDGVRAVWRCGALLTTATLVAEIVFAYGALDSTTVVDDAYIAMPGSDPTNTSRDQELWATSQEWVPCDARYAGPPPTNDELAAGVWDGGGRVMFASVGLAAHVQNRIRRRAGFFDYALESSQLMMYTPGESGAGLHARYYRTSGGPTLEVARRVVGSSPRLPVPSRSWVTPGPGR